MRASKRTRRSSNYIITGCLPLVLASLVLTFAAALPAQHRKVDPDKDFSKAKGLSYRCYDRSQKKACDELYAFAAEPGPIVGMLEAGLPDSVVLIKQHKDRPGMIQVAIGTPEPFVRKDLLLNLVPALAADEFAALSKGIPDLVSFRNGQGRTPLFDAVQNNRNDVIASLLSSHADPNAADNNGVTPLYLASWLGHLDALKALLANKANPNAADKIHQSPLDAASRAGNVDAARLLVAAGADVNGKDNKGNPVLVYAANSGKTEIVTWLLENGAEVDARDVDNRTPLCAAVMHADVASILLAHKADPSARYKDGFTPIHCAAQYGNVDSAKLLLAAGVDPRVASDEGITTLHNAAFNGRAEMVRFLVAHGVSPNATTKSGVAPLHNAAVSKSVDTVKALLEAGADMNAHGDRGLTPLDLAAEQGTAEEVQALIAAGASINDQANEWQMTPLQIAARMGNDSTVQALLAAGASVTAKDKTGETASTLAQQYQHPAAAEILLDATASPVEVDAPALQVIQSLGKDVVFFITKSHPLARLSDITDGDHQFAAAELSPRMLRVRALFTRAQPAAPQTAPSPSVVQYSGGLEIGVDFSGQGVQIGTGNSMTPLGVTYASTAGTTLMGIGQDASANLFTKYPALRLFAAIRGSAEAKNIESQDGVLRARFVLAK